MRWEVHRVPQFHTVLAIIPPGTAAGTLLKFNLPAANGITIGALANTGAVTVSYF
jgi:hypothetical protein